jgi:hypothetical protein
MSQVVNMHDWVIRRAEAKVEAARDATPDGERSTEAFEAMHLVFIASRNKAIAEQRARERVAAAQRIADECKRGTYWDPTVPPPPPPGGGR